MAKQRQEAVQKHIQYHKDDGSVWAKGFMLDGACYGYWEWFRTDGTKLRSALGPF